MKPTFEEAWAEMLASEPIRDYETVPQDTLASQGVVDWKERDRIYSVLESSGHLSWDSDDSAVWTSEQMMKIASGYPAEFTAFAKALTKLTQ